MIPYERRIETPFTELTIIPFACVHKGVSNHYAKGWEAFLERMRTDGTTHAIGVGDYIDFARSSYRTGVARTGGDSTDGTSVGAIDRFAQREAKEFAVELWPFRERIIGLSEGNHYWTFQTTDAPENMYAGETTTQYICRWLGIPYLSDTANVRLQIENELCADHYDIVANHGYGAGGATASADLGRLERVVEPAFDADLYVTAHTHRRLAYFLPRMRYGPEGFREKPHLLVKAGCFYQTYVPHKTSYADQRMLRPVDLGWVEVRLQYSEQKGGVRRTVRESMTAHEPTLLPRKEVAQQKKKRTQKHK